MGGIVVLYKSAGEESNVPMAIGLWLSLALLAVLACVIEYRAFQSLFRLFTELKRWIELQRFTGGKW